MSDKRLEEITALEIYFNAKVEKLRKEHSEGKLTDAEFGLRISETLDMCEHVENLEDKVNLLSDFLSRRGENNK